MGFTNVIIACHQSLFTIHFHLLKQVDGDSLRPDCHDTLG